ncbi:hypothetical protein DL96DRAFT_1579417, partial [Flagelloscypha sp. PMI_526]
MILLRFAFLVVGLVLRFASVHGQNTVFGENVSSISPLQTVTFVSQSGGYYIYDVPQSTEFTVHNVPARTSTATHQIPIYGSTFNITTTAHEIPRITPPITTTTQGSASTIFFTTIPVNTTKPTTHISTSLQVQTETSSPFPLTIQYGYPVLGLIASFRVTLNGSYVSHEWTIDRNPYAYNCDLSNASCSYLRNFGDNISYTEKVAPMWVVASNGDTIPQRRILWYISSIPVLLVWLCLLLFCLV